MSTDVVDDHLPDATGDQPEPPTSTVRPGDLDALEAAALAGASQWTALATWARRADDPRSADALKQLAAHADDPVAFTWLWALITARPATSDWRALQQLPDEVAVPEALRDEVAAELAAPPSDNAARDTSRKEILARQQPTTPGAIELARAVLAADATVVPAVGEEAARVLGASRDHDARAALLTAAHAAPWPQRAQMLTHLQLPLDESEVAAILGAVDESYPHLLSNVGASDPSWVRVQQLVAVLPTAHQLAVLTQDWLTQPRYADLLMAGPVMQSLGSDGASALGQLLESAAAWEVPKPMVDAVLAQLHTLPEPRAVEIAVRAHQLLGPERTAAARQHYLEQAGRYRDSLSYCGRFRPPALVALARLVLAEPPARAEPGEAAPLDQDVALLEYAEVLRPGETSGLDVTAMSGGQLRRLGAVLGLRLRGDLPHQQEQARHQRETLNPVQAATADTVTVLEVLKDHSDAEALDSPGDALCGEVVTGLVAVAPGLVADELVVVALEAGPSSTRVMARAVPSPTSAILGVYPDRWPASRTLDVLEAIPADAAVQSVEQLAGALDWDAVDSGEDLPRAAAALARHPRLLDAAVRTAVLSQEGPEAKVASVTRVRALVHALVGHDGEPGAEPCAYLEREQPQDVVELITVLVEAPGDEVHEIAGHWLTHCVPTPALVELAVSADKDTAVTPSPYSGARTTMAARLCIDARDGGQDRDTRIEALRSAQRLDPVQARASALDLVDTSTQLLARAAAGVIATTQPSPNEGDRLTALITTQSDRTTRELLERARRNMVSGSPSEALTNAIDLVGAHDSFGDLNPDICLPHEKQVWREVFRQRVDQARAASNDTPESRTNALVLLADLLAEQAIATYWIDSGKGGPGSRAEQILTRDRKKPQSGNLASEQQLLRELPLVRSWAGMRELRTAHHAPLDGSTPAPVTEQDADAALTALRRVFEGWVQTMYAFAQQPPPAAVPR